MVALNGVHFHSTFVLRWKCAPNANAATVADDRASSAYLLMESVSIVVVFEAVVVIFVDFVVIVHQTCPVASVFTCRLSGQLTHELYHCSAPVH